MIECKNVSVFYGSKKVVSDVDLNVDDGRITVLLGANGSGKSSLVGAIAGTASFSGSISIDGNDVKKLSASQKSQMLSVMPQLLSSPDISVRELVSYGRQPYTGLFGILTKKDREIVESTLAITGLRLLADESVKHISGGERQKAYIAMLLCQNTQNLLLDEPCAHLDSLYDRRISDFLIDAKHKQRAVLAVLHNINFALDVADFLYVLDKGKCIFRGRPTEFISSRIAEDHFGLTRYDCISEGKSKILYE